MKNDLSAVGGALKLRRRSREEESKRERERKRESAPELGSMESWQEVGAHTGMAHIFVDS